MSKSVYLGFAYTLDSDQTFSLKRQYLPLGKVGGRPAWLNPINLPRTEELLCSICKQPLAFLLQVYCTSPSSPLHAFHRTLFIFVCQNVECSRTNDASNFTVFRCQLPRKNDFYSPESALDPWTVGDVPDPFFNAFTFAKLCRVCGCRAAKKCAKCTQQWYCSREHQVADWTIGGHKQLCGKTLLEEGNNNLSATDSTILQSAGMTSIKLKNELDGGGWNSLTFKEFAIEMDAEDDEKDDTMEDDQMESDDEDSDECHDKIIDEKELEKCIKQFKKFDNPDCEILNNDVEELEEAAKDVFYKTFHRTIIANPTQILRYKKGGQPLLATDHSPQPKSLDEISLTSRFVAKNSVIPNCELCGAQRQFELQLMPHLLSLIDVDKPGKSIDWATLLVYSCSRDCAVPEDGYAHEFVFKQDFVDVKEENAEEVKNKR